MANAEFARPLPAVVFAPNTYCSNLCQLLEESKMRNQRSLVVAALTAATLVAFGCSNKTASSAVDPAKLSSFAPLPDAVPGKAGAPAEEQISLGRMLYYDARLSQSQTISCNTCHQLAKYGVDGQATSTGFKGSTGAATPPRCTMPPATWRNSGTAALSTWNLRPRAR